MAGGPFLTSNKAGCFRSRIETWESISSNCYCSLLKKAMSKLSGLEIYSNPAGVDCSAVPDPNYLNQVSYSKQRSQPSSARISKCQPR
jgi:hypothetical protein